VSTPPDTTEAQLRAALAAAAPDDTHLDAGLGDLQARLDSRTAPAPVAGRPGRSWLLAAAAAVLVVAAVAGAVLLRPDDEPSRASDPPVTAPSGLRAADLELRPVLSTARCASPATTSAVEAVVLADAAGEYCYALGPVLVDGTSLSQAEAAQQETWVVTVRARPDAVDQVNGLFNDCYQATSRCPALSGSGRGAVAIVFDGQLIGAPEVNGPDLADDAFTISSVDGFTRAEAMDLAAAINAG
jgi:hypothetical protein